MSSRWYPIYKVGNPQLRIFLPNFTMKLVKPKCEQPPNVVTFQVPVKMTNYDIKNYLQEIYKIPVVKVSSFIEMGLVKKVRYKGYLVKDDDYRVANITLPSKVEFLFPNLLSDDRIEGAAKEQQDSSIKQWDDERQIHKHRSNIPSWFGL